MPYIKISERLNWMDSGLRDLLRAINGKTKAGDLNFIIFSIMKRAVGKTLCYKRLNELLGVFTCATKEFYRRIVAPYEDEKIKSNGDIDVTDDEIL